MNHHQDAQNTFPANSVRILARTRRVPARTRRVQMRSVRILQFTYTLFFELAEFPYELALPKIWFFEKLAIGYK